MRTHQKKFKYWVVFTSQTSGKKSEKDITWEKLVKVVGEKRPNQIKAVNFCHHDAPLGTAHVDGKTMLALWKEVEKASKPAA